VRSRSSWCGAHKPTPGGPFAAPQSFAIQESGWPEYRWSVDRKDLLRTITAAHRELAHLVEGISDDRLRDPARGDWKGKDLLAHLAWWHDHSMLVIEGLRAGRQPYDGTDPANSTDAMNERAHREHLDDRPDETRVAFDRSFERLLAAIEPLNDDDLFAADRWPWLGKEALVDTVLWDTSRHYEAHREHLAPLSQKART
jgi:hypothetical protein